MSHERDVSSPALQEFIGRRWEDNTKRLGSLALGSIEDIDK